MTLAAPITVAATPVAKWPFFSMISARATHKLIVVQGGTVARPSGKAHVICFTFSSVLNLSSRNFASLRLSVKLTVLDRLPQAKPQRRKENRKVRHYLTLPSFGRRQ